jgi:hypothetical protein
VTPFGPGEGGDVTVGTASAAAALYARVVFNRLGVAERPRVVCVTGTGARRAAGDERGVGGPAGAAVTTLDRLPAVTNALPPITDAPIHERLRAIGERELAWRVADARALYDARRARGGAPE